MTLSSLTIDRNYPSPKAASPRPGHASPVAVKSRSPRQIAAAVVPGSTLERSLSFKNWHQDAATAAGTGIGFSSPKPISKLNAAATTLQKVYKSYRTRRNLADCAVVVEELWWKTIDLASLERSSVSFFSCDKAETAGSRWARATRRLAKVGKGLSKDEKAQKLALQHWLEAIDPRHRYGHNLHLYYDVWFASESCEPFFYWLDVGAGRELTLEKCPRSKLQQQVIKYLNPSERAEYEVLIQEGKLIYKQKNIPVNTTEGSKWIFVLSTSQNLYVGEKKKGSFQHSSFMAGGAISAAGRLVADNGVLKAIWPYSGHYLPTEDNFNKFLTFLKNHGVDLSNVRRCSVDDDTFPSFKKGTDGPVAPDATLVAPTVPQALEMVKEEISVLRDLDVVLTPVHDITRALANRMSPKWTSGTGARIGCVRDYPLELQVKALEQVNLSPRVTRSPGWVGGSKAPIPSPRPSPKLRVSPRLQYMAFPAFPAPPEVALTLPEMKGK